jgi:uncharacterized protein (TIGR03435 family)
MGKLLLSILTVMAAAAATRSFDVASVKTNKLGSAGGEGRTTEKIDHSPMSLTMTNVTLSSCIKWAWGVENYQISGAPGWLTTERYDIAAKTAAHASDDELHQMLQELLVERFHFAFHREHKDLPIYALVTGRNGPKFHKSAVSGPPSMRPSEGSLVFQNVSMAELATRFASRPLKVDRPVIDKTGLNEAYDFSLKFAGNAAELKSTLEGMDRGDSSGASIFTIVQEQLGLRLEPRKGPVEILVVDGASKVPVDN